MHTASPLGMASPIFTTLNSCQQGPSLARLFASARSGTWSQQKSQKQEQRKLDDLYERGTLSRSEYNTASARLEDERETRGAVGGMKQGSLAQNGEGDEQQQLSALEHVGTKEHMRKVYATMGGCIAVCAGGSALSATYGLFLSQPIIPAIAAFVPLIGFMMTDKTSNENYRLALLSSFSLLEGMSLTPLMMAYTSIDPTIVPTAFAGASTVFIGATMASLFAPRGSMLPMGAPLLGGLIGLVGLNLANFFFHSSLLHDINLYGGLGLFTVFVGYDTHKTIAKFEGGDDDHLQHSVDFFLDFLNIFVRMMQIVARKD